MNCQATHCTTHVSVVTQLLLELIELPLCFAAIIGAGDKDVVPMQSTVRRPSGSCASFNSKSEAWLAVVATVNATASTKLSFQQFC